MLTSKISWLLILGYFSSTLQVRIRKLKPPKLKDIQNQEPYNAYDYDSEYEDSYENYDDDTSKYVNYCNIL